MSSVNSTKQNRPSFWRRLEDTTLTCVLCLTVFGLLKTAHCQTNPAPPSRTNWRILPDPAPKPPGFWTVHRSADPPLRTNKQTLKSPWYIVPNVLSIGASVANVTRSRRAGAAYGDAMAGAIPLAGFSYVFDRYVARFIAVGPPFYIIGLRTYGAVTRTYK